MTIRVGMFPSPFADDEWSRQGNEILHFIAEALEQEDCDIIALSQDDLRYPDHLTKQSIDVIHLHWPFLIYNFEEDRARAHQAGIWGKRYIPGLLHKWLDWKISRTSLKTVSNWAAHMRKSQIPLVWQIHDIISHHTQPNSPVFPADQMLYRAVYEYAGGIVLHEQSCADPVFARYGIRNHYTIGRLGDLSTTYGPQRDQKSAKESLRLTHTGKTFSYIGVARPNRNPRNACKAFLSVAGQQDRLLVAGLGIDAYTRDISDQRIMLYPGFQEPKRIRDLFCASDFVVNDGEQYMTSGVIRTAMSYGVPVITRPYGAAINMAQNAAIFIPESAEGLSRAFREAMHINSDTLNSMRATAAMRHKERTWKKFAESVTKLYREICGID